MADEEIRAWTSAVGTIECPDWEERVYITVIQPSGEAQHVEFPRGLTPTIIAALAEEADRG